MEPDNILLTAGSSVSYGLLFSALHARSGRTSVALPRPGYPLFDRILGALGLEPRWYRCPPSDGFLPDLSSIDALLAADDPPAALVLISPNNPTGVTYPDTVVDEIAARCTAAGMLLVLDEVFSLYRRGGTTPLVIPGGAQPGMTAHLNGASKLAAAPEIKLGWIALSGGTAGARAELAEALETEHDTYLTLSGFAEASVVPMITAESARTMQETFRRQVDRLREEMYRALSSVPALEPVATDSGIHIPLAVDPVEAAAVFGTTDDEMIALRVIEETGVVVHPGYFYGFGRDTAAGLPWMVVSALTPPAVRDRAVAALSELFRRRSRR